MSWRDAWRLAGPAYNEVSFQAIYALRQGNVPPVKPGENLAEVARRRVAQSKLLVSGILGMLILGASFGLGATPEHLITNGLGLDRGLYVATIVAALLTLELALLWWTGLQVLPTLLASKVLPLLETLPVPAPTLRRVSFLLLLRLYDAPIVTCLVLTPLGVGLALGSWVAALVAIPSVLIVSIFAMALSLQTGRFFVTRVQGAHAGGGQTALRWAYLVLWAVPAFAMYGFLAVAPGFLKFLADVSAGGPSTGLMAILVAFPMSLGGLVAIAGASTPIVDSAGALLVVASFAYGLLAIGAAAWLRGGTLRLTREIPIATLPTVQRPFRLTTESPSFAIVRKDLRIASRTPGYAFVILLPLLDAFALGLLTFTSAPSAAAVAALAAGAVATATLLAIFFGPALFAIEVMGYSYVRTLPLGDRSMVAGKVTLVTGLYLASAGIVTAFTLGRVFAPLPFLAFIVAELPAVMAASLLEFGILFARARRSGLPIVNLYTGAWWATAVAIPGLLVAGLPLVLYDWSAALGTAWALPGMAILAGAELAAIGPLSLALTGRGAR